MNGLSEQQVLLADNVDKLFAAMADTPAVKSASVKFDAAQFNELWTLAEDNGVASIFVPEAAGGFGGNWQDAFVVLNAAGFHAVPLPIAETLIARKLLVEAGMPMPTGVIAIAAADTLQIERAHDAGWVSGSAQCVAWGNAASNILVVEQREGQATVALVDSRNAHMTNAHFNIAGEPATSLSFERVEALSTGSVRDSPFEQMALMRAVQMSGALNAALRRSVQYANERIQFGKPIAKFQVIQHSLALLANEAAAVNCAAWAACCAADRGAVSFEIAAAKLRANRSVDVATSIAHQIHGAIGFTREHSLHLFTQRLWSWRSDYGNDRYWAARLGDMVAARGADNLWSDLTARTDPQ